MRHSITATLLLALGLALSAGCGDGSTNTDDGKPDASVARDAGGARDAGSGSDAGPSVDAGTVADAGTVEDAGEEQPLTVGWCRLQHPVDADALVGESLTVYGRVFVEGLTDRTDAVDTDPRLVAQVGVGGRGTQPDDTWSWSAASANATWSGSAAGEERHDEWQGVLVPVAAGSFDHAFRFSADGGATWTYCDRNAGQGADGSADGYQTANAGHLEVHAGVCNPPCDQGQRCVDGACIADQAGTVGWCKLQWNPDLTAAAGSSATFYGRVYVAGITDRSTGNDPSSMLIGEFGYGPHGILALESWTFTRGEPNPGWAPTTAPDTSNDEYQATLTLPAAGTYDTVWRFSADGGSTWAWCDVTGSSPSDPFQTAELGNLVCQ